MTTTSSTATTAPLLQPLKSANRSLPPQSPPGCRFLALIIPSDEGERSAQAMENWLQACSSDEPFSLEIVGTRRAQGFLLRASSEEQLTLLTKQLEAQYPQADIQRIAPQADPLLLHPGEQAAIGEFALTQPSFLPLKTFSGKTLAEPGADPLAGILASMEAIGAGKRVVVQLALCRAPESWLAADIRKTVEHALQAERDDHAASLKGHRQASDVNEGGKILLLMLAGGVGLFAYRWYQAQAWAALTLLGVAMGVGLLAGLWWLFTRRRTPVYESKLVAEKMARAAFYSQLRVFAVGRQGEASEAELTSLLHSMEVAYRQFTHASSNSLYLKRQRLLLAEHSKAPQLCSAQQAFPYAHLLLRLAHSGAYSKHILNALEISGMFHLPQESADLPLVYRVSRKGILASPEIAHQLQQQSAPQPPTLLGYSQHRRYQVPVLLPFDAAFTHTFLDGASRSGKTVYIQHRVRAAMQPVGRAFQASTPQPGVFVADPHRDLIMDLLKQVPPARAQDVLLLDMTDTDYPVALNPLDASMGFTRDQAVGNLMSSFQRIWAEQWGPRMAYFLNSVCLLLYVHNEQLVREGHPEKQHTLLDINPILQYKDYARSVLSQLDLREAWQQEMLMFWQNTYFQLNPAFKNEIIMPIISKIGVFSDNAQLRRIVGQPITKAPVHKAITEGKIVLCALSAKNMDDSAVNILGSSLINLLHRSFSLQQHLPLQKRRKVFVAIDEFQNFSGSDYDKLLSEDAKYGCAVLLATQNLKRLNKIRDGLLEMVLSNCQQLGVFRVSAADAKILEEELQQKVTVKHLISLPPLHCYARITIAGHPQQIVSMTLPPPPSWSDHPVCEQIARAIRRTNQARYLPAAEVDRIYEEHLRQFLDVSALTNRLKREVRSVQAKKKEQDEADQRARDLQAAQILTGTKAGTSSGSPGPASDEEFEEEEEENPPDEGEGDDDGSDGTAPTGKSGKSSRNHRRSRRTGKKHPVGTPPPETDANDTSEEEPERLVPGVGGTILGGSMSWGRSSGYEGREGRERG